MRPRALDHWQVVLFGTPKALSVGSIVKLSHTCDQRTSLLVVYPDDKDQLWIWGFIDQQVRYRNFVEHEATVPSHPPGMFQIAVEDVGVLEATSGFYRLAELRRGVLSAPAVDPLQKGPVAASLAPGRERFVIECSKGATEGLAAYQLDRIWTDTLRRLLLRIRSHGHGGSLLVGPESQGYLRHNYEINYGRLHRGMRSVALARLKADRFREQVRQGEVGVALKVLAESERICVARAEAESELSGALWFVSLLSRMDGAVILSPDLEVRSFGTEILVVDEPPLVSAAEDVMAEQTSALAYDHYGTRHRSAMRYCVKVPGAVAFVVSQDGQVRCLTSIEGHVVMWPDISLQYQPSRKRMRKARAR
jgi:hypothetical protein